MIPFDKLKEKKPEIQMFIDNWQPESNADYAQTYFKNDLTELLWKIYEMGFDEHGHIDTQNV